MDDLLQLAPGNRYLSDDLTSGLKKIADASLYLQVCELTDAVLSKFMYVSAINYFVDFSRTFRSIGCQTRATCSVKR